VLLFCYFLLPFR